MADQNILVRVGADISNLTSGLRDATSRLSSFARESSATFQKIGNAGKGLAVTGAAAAAASGAVLGIGLNYLASAEKTKVGLETLTGSAAETKTIMKDLQKFALKTPFEFEGLVAGTRRLIGMGMASEQATSMIKATSDAVAAAGGGAEELDGVVTALGQIAAKGKVSSEEVNQAAERGIPLWRILSEQMGKTPAELMKMAEEGKLLAKDALPAIQKGFENSFGGASAEQANTFSGRLANLKEQATLLASTVAKPLFEPLSSAMGKAVAMAQTFSTWFQKLPTGVQTFATAAMILVPILAILGGGLLMVIGALPSIAMGFAALPGILSAFTAAITTTVAPIMLAIAAIVAIGAALVLAYQKVDWFRNMVNTAFAFIKNIISSVMNAVGSFISSKLEEIRKFWDANGKTIMAAIKNVMSFISTQIRTSMEFIKGIFQAVFPIIQGVVQVAWSVIKLAFSNAIDLILGVIKFFSKVFTGDWKGAFNTVKETATKIMKNIVSTFKGIDLLKIGKDIIQGLINGISSMAGAIGRKVKEIADIIPNGVKKLLDINSPIKKKSDKRTKLKAKKLAQLLTSKPLPKRSIVLKEVAFQ